MTTVGAVILLSAGWLLGRIERRSRTYRPVLDDREWRRRRTLGFWIPKG